MDIEVTLLCNATMAMKSLGSSTRPLPLQILRAPSRLKPAERL
jgi:hypothetical protein